MDEAMRTQGGWSTQRASALVLALVVVHFMWMALDLGGHAVTRYVSNFAQFFAAFGSGVLCIRTGLNREGGCRRAWILLGLGALSWGLGQMYWTLYELQPHASAPVLSPANFAYFALAPLTCLAAIAFVDGKASRLTRIRMTLDTFTVGGVLLFFSWHFGIGPILQTESTVVETVAVLLYPIGDLILATVAITIVVSHTTAPSHLRKLALFALALCCFIGANTAYRLLALSDRYQTGSIVDTGWFAAFAILAFAAVMPPAMVRRSGDALTPSLWGRVLPGAAATVVLTSVLARAAMGDSVDAVSVVIACTLTVTVLGRQVLAVVEQHRIAHILEAREADRTTQLSRQEEQFRALVQHSSDLIAIVAADGTFSYVSPAAEQVLALTPDHLLGTPAIDIIAKEDRSRVHALMSMAARTDGITLNAEWRVRRADGGIRQVEALMRNLLSEVSVAGIVLNLRDVSERKALEDQLKHQALHDDLTGLPNRAMLRRCIEEGLTSWLFKNEPFTLLVLDLDDFKSINDSLGHVAGDTTLKTIADRLSRCARRGDTLIRLDGDEFAILVAGVSAADAEVHRIAQRMIAAVQEPIRVEGRSLALRCSVGVACVTDDVSQPDDLMRNADLALHTAKSTARGGYVLFETGMHDSALRRVELEGDLRRAIEQAQFQVYYQPTVDLETGTMEGVEALLRWAHPEKGFISPADFIPIAEESGLIVPIGTWVLRQACNEVHKWQMRYPTNGTPLKVNVNLSARQLLQPDIVEVVKTAIEESGIAPGSLVLEMTESVLMDNSKGTLDKMNQLVALGVELAIDDFGTGYSSLSYLRQFPISVLKIDRSFVSGVAVDGSEEEGALVKAILDLASTLNLRTVAEGIETAGQLSELRRMGCQVGQGFLLARPLPAEDVRRIIEKTRAVGLPISLSSTS